MIKTRVESDLICSIIRKSQSNLWDEKGFNKEEDPEVREELILTWVKKNAKAYREHFEKCLSSCSAIDLSNALDEILHTGKYLGNLSSISCEEYVEKSDT